MPPLPHESVPDSLVFLPFVRASGEKPFLPSIDVGAKENHLLSCEGLVLGDGFCGTLPLFLPPMSGGVLVPRYIRLPGILSI